MGDALEQREQVGVEGRAAWSETSASTPHTVVVDEDRQRELGVELARASIARRSTGSLTSGEVVRSVIDEAAGSGPPRRCGRLHAPLAQPIDLHRRQAATRRAGSGARAQESSRYIMPTGEPATPSTTSSVCSAVETRSLLDPIVTAAA